MLWIILALIIFIFQIIAIVMIEYRRPNKAIAWVMVSYLFPIIGFLLYYFMARKYSQHHFSIHQNDSSYLNQIETRLFEESGLRAAENMLDHARSQEARLVSVLKKMPNAPFTTYKEATVFADCEQAFDAMLNAMETASDHIHIEFYTIRDDRIGQRFQQLMIKKAKQGIKVRLLYDGIGSYQLKDSYLEDLHAAGVETGCFLPPRIAFIERRLNYRNHRKIVVVDGEIGFFGGLNIGDEYLGKNPKLGYWRDTHLEIKGKVVLWLQHTFLTDWQFVKGQILTDSRYFPLHQNNGEKLIQIVKGSPDSKHDTVLEVFFSFINSAKKRIYIATPYFIPDPSIMMALKIAAISGIDIRIIIPVVSDFMLVQWASLSYVQELLQVGIRFYQYQKGFIHAKVMIIDNLAFCGTANMDLRSFFDQFEINAVIFDQNIVDRFELDFRKDLSDSKEILFADFEKRPNIQKIKEAFARLLSPLL